MAKLLNAVISILVLIIILSMSFLISIIYPFALDQVRVYPPTPNSIKYIENGTNLETIVPLHISDNGPYAINNFEMTYKILNKTSLIYQGHQNLGKILGNYHKNLIFNIDLLQLYNDEKNMSYYHFFHYDNFTITSIFTGDYGLGMISFNLTLNFPYEWIPPIKMLNIGKNYQLISNNSSYIFVVPYSINTAHYLSGSANISSKLDINSSLISSATYIIPLGKYYSSTIDFVIPSNQVKNLMNNLNYIYIINIIGIFGIHIKYEVTYG